MFVELHGLKAYVNIYFFTCLSGEMQNACLHCMLRITLSVCWSLLQVEMQVSRCLCASRLGVMMQSLRTVIVPSVFLISSVFASPSNSVSHVITAGGFPLAETHVATVIFISFDPATIVGVDRLIWTIGRAAGKTLCNIR